MDNDNKTNLNLDAISPFVRKVGVQGGFEWKNKYRRIYDHEWMYCTSGKAYYETETEQYELKAGSLLLIEPNTPHRFWFDEKQRAAIKWVHFDFEYRKDVYDLDKLVCNDRTGLFFDALPSTELLRKSYRFNDRYEIPTVIEVQDRDRMNRIFDRILAAYKQHHMTWQLTAKANIIMIIKMVIDHLNDGKNILGAADQSDLIKEICYHIENNYHNKLTRKKLAAYYGYNEDYIGKLFKREMSRSISTYINEIRIQKAKELLSHTDLSVQNISELIGFSDVFYFSKKMKTMTGMSPTEWR